MSTGQKSKSKYFGLDVGQFKRLHLQRKVQQCRHMQAALAFPAIWLESRPIRIHNSSPASKLSAKPKSFS
jgi:hypothetical protein